MDGVVNQRPQTLVAVKKIVYLSEEVLDEQYGPLQKKKKTSMVVGTGEPQISPKKFRMLVRIILGRGRTMMANMLSKINRFALFATRRMSVSAGRATKVLCLWRAGPH